MSGRERAEAIINTGRESRTVRSVCSLALAVCSASLADEFTQADLDRWTKEYEAVVAKGEKLFHGGLNSKNTVSCDQYHPNASNTHPETYPKLQKQLGKVFEMWEMVN
jgi:uncharacterized protein (DUF2252 family)